MAVGICWKWRWFIFSPDIFFSHNILRIWNKWVELIESQLPFQRQAPTEELIHRINYTHYFGTFQMWWLPSILPSCHKVMHTLGLAWNDTHTNLHILCNWQKVCEIKCVCVGRLSNNAAFVCLGDLADKFRAAGDRELSLWVAQLEWTGISMSRLDEKCLVKSDRHIWSYPGEALVTVVEQRTKRPQLHSKPSWETVQVFTWFSSTRIITLRPTQRNLVWDFRMYNPLQKLKRGDGYTTITGTTSHPRHTEVSATPLSRNMVVYRQSHSFRVFIGISKYQDSNYKWPMNQLLFTLAHACLKPYTGQFKVRMLFIPLAS